MKTTLLAALVALLAIFGTSNQASACVDNHPDSVRVFILGDSLCNLEIQLRNLQLFGGDPNHFCSCGVADAMPPGYEIQYVGFADVETEEPVEGFDSWAFSGQAGTSWETVDAQGYDWSGFVSHVNDAGLFAAQDVYMVIRVLNTTGLDCTELGIVLEFFTNGAFSTDEWDPTAEDLADSHQSITYFSNQSWENFSTEIVDPSHFQALDEIWLGVEDVEVAPEFQAYPIPSHTQVTISSQDRLDLLQMRSVTGKIVFTLQPNRLQTEIDVSELPRGIYLVSAHAKGLLRTKRIVVD